MQLSPRTKSLLKTVAYAAPLSIVGAELLRGVELKDFIDRDTARELLLLVFRWGPAVLILAGVYILTLKFMAGFVQSQKDQAIAMSQVATAVQIMAERDASERKEIRIALSVMNQKMDEIHEGTEFRRKGALAGLLNERLSQLKDELNVSRRQDINDALDQKLKQVKEEIGRG